MVSLSEKHCPSWEDENFQRFYHSHRSMDSSFPGIHNCLALLWVSSHYKRHLTEFDKYTVGRPRLVRPYLPRGLRSPLFRRPQPWACPGWVRGRVGDRKPGASAGGTTRPGLSLSTRLLPSCPGGWEETAKHPPPTAAAAALAAECQARVPHLPSRGFGVGTAWLGQGVAPLPGPTGGAQCGSCGSGSSDRWPPQSWAPPPVWPVSFSIIPCRSIHVVTNGKISFF